MSQCNYSKERNSQKFVIVGRFCMWIFPKQGKDCWGVMFIAMKCDI